MASGASFRQFEKSNGRACKSPLHYRPLSHNQALEIHRLKQVLDEFKGSAEIERIASFGAIHSDQNVRRLCAAQIISGRTAAATTELGSFNQTKQR